MDELCNVAIEDAQSALAVLSCGDADTILFGSQEQRFSCELFVEAADAVISASRDFKGHASAMRMDKERWTAAELKELEEHTRNGSWRLMWATVTGQGMAISKFPYGCTKISETARTKLDCALCCSGKGQRYGED